MALEFIRIRVRSLGSDMGRPVHSASRGLTLARLEVVGVIRVRVDSLGRA